MPTGPAENDKSVPGASPRVRLSRRRAVGNRTVLSSSVPSNTVHLVSLHKLKGDVLGEQNVSLLSLVVGQTLREQVLARWDLPRSLTAGVRTARLLALCGHLTGVSL